MNQAETLNASELALIERLRSLIGTRLDGGSVYDALHGIVPFVTEINYDAINHYAWAVDDLNPLWMDSDYAAKSAVGKIVAPPSIIVQLHPGGMGGCLFFPLDATFGEHETWGGTRVRWYRWFTAGMRLMPESRLTDVDVKQSPRSGPMVKLTATTRFFDQVGNEIAEASFWIFRKRSQNYGTRFEGVEMRHWTPAELENLRAEQRQYTRRGSVPRRARDVTVGDTFDLLKGPYSMMANMCFLSMCSPQRFFRGDVAWSDAERELSKAGGQLDHMWSSPLGFPDVTNAHWNNSQAREDGLVGAFDYGTQRASWGIQLFTDWMGDAGFLQEFEFQVRGFNYIGDVQRFSGTVLSKRHEGGNCLVNCGLKVTNQRGEITAAGSAVVALPSEGDRAVPAPG